MSEAAGGAVEAESKDIPLLLKFDHNVVEHLGIKLYQNKPTNVIAELVSNAWDADAKSVWIDLHHDLTEPKKSFVRVVDTGLGMTLDQIRDKYLVIGLPKRDPKVPGAMAPSGRKQMGRKGIGKLAPFGIAGAVDVVSAAKSQSGAIKINWFRLEIAGIMQSSDTHSYPPVQVFKDLPWDERDKLAEMDTEGVLGNFLSRLEGQEDGKRAGTLICMRSLSLRKPLQADAVMAAMGRRFTVTLLRPDFKVFVNEEPMSQDKALPKFDFRIPPTGITTENVNGHEVKYWAGFVGTADWSQDEAGVGIYVHGKIGQDRPFTFGQKGREILSRYMYAVVEADWLDELPEDMVSTDRTSINWEHEESQALYKWGQQKVKEWLDRNLEWRTTAEQRSVEEQIKVAVKAGALPSYSEVENEQIAKLVSKITPNLARDAEGQAAKAELIKTVAVAWSNRPMRELMKGIWDRLAHHKGGDSVQGVASIIEELRAHSVPEFLSLGLTFAQRAYALGLMDKMINDSLEIDLQHLMEAFPWILDPAGNLLTANRQLKTAADAILAAQPTGTRLGRSLSAVDESERPDFVFLEDGGSEIVVVEIKRPGHALSKENRRQLKDYMDAIEERFGHLSVRGVLIAGRTDTLEITDSKMTAFTWQQILERSKNVYIEMIVAMLKEADPDPKDDRLKMIREFGGPKNWEILRKIAQKDEQLKTLIEQFDAVSQSASMVAPAMS